MDKKEITIAVIVVAIALMVGIFIFAPSNEVSATTIELLNKGDLGENSTVYIKLTDWEKTALDNKTVHIKLINDKNEVVYDESVETHITGVALAKLDNVSAGNYTLNVTFDGDERYKDTSLSQKVTVNGDVVEDDISDSDLVDQTLAATSSPTTTTHSQTTHTQSTSSDSSSSSDSGSDDSYYDENGKEILNEYDENGKLIDPTE